MGLGEWFGWNRQGGEPLLELPDIFPVPVEQALFIEIDIIAIYSKILTDVLERMDGISDEHAALMWDNCLKSEKPDGLITLVAKAMAHRRQLFLVFEKSVNVIREATGKEASQIQKDYATQAKSSAGVFVSFQNFRRSDMVKFYLALSYCAVSSLWKSMNLSKAIQLKFNDLRASVSLADADDAKSQAKKIASSLAQGRDVMLDAKDLLETAKPDLTATQAAAEFVCEKLAFYLGMPDSYISGEQTAGIGSTGENDMRAVERGLKAYYFSILKPVLEALLEVKTSYKSQDFRQIESATEIIKTFALVDDTMISAENKRKLINALLGLPEDAEGDPPPKPAPAPAALPAPAPKPGSAPPANA